MFLLCLWTNVSNKKNINAQHCSAYFHTVICAFSWLHYAISDLFIITEKHVILAVFTY